MPLRTIARACATLAVVSGTASSAVAQGATGYSTSGDDLPLENGALSVIGSVVGGLRIDASLATLYDANMLRLGKGFQGPGIDTSDFRISPAATVSYGSAIGRQQLHLSGSIGRDIYTRNTVRNRNFYSVNGGLNWRLGTRCTGDLSGNFSSRQQLFSELAAATANVQETLTFGGSAMCRTATGLGFGGAINRTTTRNDSVDRALFNTDSTSFSPQLTYGTPVLGQFSLSGSLNKVSYPDRTVFNTGGTLEKDSVDILSGRFGYQRGLGGRLSINFGASYFDVKPRPVDILIPVVLGPGATVFIPQTRQSNSNIGFDVGLAYNSGSRLTAELSARKSAQASINVGAQYQVVQAISGTIGYRLNGALSLNTGASYTQRDYRNAFSSVPEPSQRLQDKVSRVFAGATYAPSKLYAVSGEVSYQDRKSDPDIYSYNSVAAVLRLRVGFGGRG